MIWQGHCAANACAWHGIKLVVNRVRITAHRQRELLAALQKTRAVRLVLVGTGGITFIELGIAIAAA